MVEEPISYTQNSQKMSYFDASQLKKYRPFSHCIDQAGLGAFTAKSGRKHYNPPPLTVM